jgi:hypothetical protein
MPSAKIVKNPAWVDTVNVPYGSSVDLVMDFLIQSFAACRSSTDLLGHEDKGMMAKILFR